MLCQQMTNRKWRILYGLAAMERKELTHHPKHLEEDTNADISIEISRIQSASCQHAAE